MKDLDNKLSYVIKNILTLSVVIKCLISAQYCGSEV